MKTCSRKSEKPLRKVTSGDEIQAPETPQSCELGGQGVEDYPAHSILEPCVDLPQGPQLACAQPLAHGTTYSNCALAALDRQLGLGRGLVHCHHLDGLPSTPGGFCPLHSRTRTGDFAHPRGPKQVSSLSFKYSGHTDLAEVKFRIHLCK